MPKNWGVSEADEEFRPINSRESYDDLLTMQSGQHDVIWEDGRQRTAAQSADTISKRIEILLDKDPKGEGFGFVLRGGAYCGDAPVPLPLTVTKIIPGSPAEREGTLQVGDRILEINGADMSQFTVQQAANILSEAENDVTLLVEYDVVVLDWISNATGPVVVEIEKPVGKVLDITLSSTTWNGVNVIYIDSVYEAGIADRSGSLHIGDHVSGIDGFSVKGKTASQATSLLNSNVTDRIQLEIYPVSAQATRELHMGSRTNVNDESLETQLYDNIRPQNNRISSRDEATILSSDEFNNSAYSHPSSRRHHQHHHHHHLPNSNRSDYRLPPPPPPSYSTLNLSTVRGLSPPLKPTPARSATPPNSFQLRNITSTPNGVHRTTTIRTPAPTTSRPGTRSATPPAPPFRAKRLISGSSGGLAHGFGAPSGTAGMSPGKGSAAAAGRRFQKASLNPVDETEVVLFSKDNEFGIEIEELGTDGTSVVTHLEPSGVADRCGLIQEGDRVLAINGQNTKGKTTEEIHQLIAFSSSGILRILIEFNVADSIVVNSGTIMVKLIKYGSNLGLTFACPDNRKPGEPLVISEIRKGSASHRIGALCVGDALLSIDDNDVTNSSVDHVTRMLDSCIEVVQFTIRKKESITGATSASNFVIFSVELPLPFGGNLGITLSEERKSSSHSNRIIIITAIAEGSIAQLTSAVRIGDEVLSINGVALDSKSLKEAQELLVNSVASVCFKIKRHTHKTVHGSENVGQKAQNSVDSAVESCDSSSTPNSDSMVNSSAPSAQPSSPRQRLTRHKESRSQICNEVKVQAEVHHSPDDTILHDNTDQRDVQTRSIADRFPLPVSPPLVIQPSGLSVAEDEDEWSCKVDELDRLPAAESTELLTGSIAPLDPPHVNGARSRSNVTSQPLSDANDVRDQTTEGERENGDKKTDGTAENVTPIKVLTNFASGVGSKCHVTKGKVSASSTAENSESQLVNSIVELRQREKKFFVGEPDQTVLEGPEELGPDHDPDPDSCKAKELHQLEELLESIFTPTPVELLRVVLYKLRSTDDFGFSLSDGVYEKGVYVSGVKPNGPASEGLLPFDKILQVNKVKTKDLDCHQVVPLIAQSGNCVELIVCRNALASSLPLERSRTARNSTSSESSEPPSIHPQSSTWNSKSQADQLWKPRCKRKVNFLPKNTFF